MSRLQYDNGLHWLMADHETVAEVLAATPHGKPQGGPVRIDTTQVATRLVRWLCALLLAMALPGIYASREALSKPVSQVERLKVDCARDAHRNCRELQT